MAKQDKKERDVLIQQEAEAMRAILNIPDDELVLMDWDDTGEEQFHQKILPEDVQPKENWIELINI